MLTEFSLKREVNIGCGQLKNRCLWDTKQCKELNLYIDTVRLKVYEIYRELIANNIEVSATIIRDKFWAWA